ncbi:MAG: hypothetical protein JSV98_10800 [candidate division WOR-3 bacterium]|nr:MAG: hypothetical protein JSV98_10800 [candidate division WOR-3 bacterium]
MKPSADLGEIRRSTSYMNFQDGLMDIVLGVHLVLTYFVIEYRLLLNIPWIVIGPVIVEAIRKRTTYPRIGYARMANRGTTALRILLVCMVGIVLLSVLTALIFLLLGLPVQNNWHNVLKIAAVLLIPVIFGLLAHEHKVYRWFVYGLLIGLGGLLVRAVAPQQIQYYFIFLGIGVIIVGIRIFIEFLKNNPLPPVEGTNGGE